MQHLSVPGVLIVALVACQTWAAEPSRNPTLSRRAVDDPSSADFLRRSFAAAAVVGDFVYIDGGEVSQRVDGVLPPNDAPSSPVNSTLSISLKESWTNATVPINVIAKQAPVLNSQAVWTDSTTGSFWTWGGGAPASGSPPDDDRPWRFLANGSGGGFWSVEAPANPRLFDQLVRPQGCAFTQKDNDVGYCMGGLAVTSQGNASTSSSSSSSSAGDSGDRDNATATAAAAIPGLISVGMRSGVWTNDSTAGLGGSGTLVGGTAEFVPFGPNGLVALLGGAPAADSAADRDLASVTLLDPVTQQWFTQGTTGPAPAARQRHCTVGARSPAGTYEIFLYGGVVRGPGTTTPTATTSDEVFVLSLPGFVWARAADAGASTRRADHACAVVGAGGRQMLSVGGADAALGPAAAALDPDPWARGLGVLDMTALRWSGGYDAAAPAYEAPDAVRDFYAAGGLGRVAWSSDAVKAIFTSSTPDFGSGTNPSPSATGTASPGGKGRPATLSRAAVVGIACGVSVLVLGLAGGALAYLLLRRRRRQRSSAADALRAGGARRRSYSRLRDGGRGPPPAGDPPMQQLERQRRQGPTMSGALRARSGGSGSSSSNSQGGAGAEGPAPATLRSDLASRRGVGPLRAIHTGQSAGLTGVRIYQGAVGGRTGK